MDRGVERTPSSGLRIVEERRRSGRISRNLCFKSGDGEMRRSGGRGRAYAKVFFYLTQPSP